MAIALALGGGAALGWGHIGFLRTLQEEKVEIGAVAGTSIGALAALCVAADRLDALEKIARETTRRRMLVYLDPHWRSGAFLGGRRIARELGIHLGDISLEALPIPIALIATDLITAEEVRLTEGPAIQAVQASMALPGLFPAVRIDGRRLIDGGMTGPVPIAAARALAPALPLVSVDLMGDYAGHAISLAGRESALRTMRSAFLIMAVSLGRQAVEIHRPEVPVVLPVGHRSTGDFHRAAELIAIGRAAARDALPAIRAAGG